MLKMLGTTRPCCDGITRREPLAAGALTTLGGGFSLPGLMAAEEATDAPLAGSGKAKNVILLYLLGGAPTQDLYDLKPGARRTSVALSSRSRPVHRESRSRR